MILLSLLLLGASLLQTPVRPGSSPQAANPDPNMARPIAAQETVFLEEMTWLEVRDAMRAGKRTVIVATGGVEMNGPYLALGKHNYILRATTEAIATKLGDALIAPIVPFVPEGDISPPSGHMRYPGTVSVRPDTFKALLADIAESLRTHGFEHVIFIADSGGNVAGMKGVAADLSAKWGARPTIHYIAEYYDYPGLSKWLEGQGIREVDEGIHDDYGISSIMMTVDPALVRMKERIAAGRFSINGVPLAPAEKTIDMGRKAADWRATVTVEAIRKALGAAGR
jgi:creatinine amidohydrolase/Fe(II)-dependent formamide hydrolase-like protein